MKEIIENNVNIIAIPRKELECLAAGEGGIIVDEYDTKLMKE